MQFAVRKRFLTDLRETNLSSPLASTAHRFFLARLINWKNRQTDPARLVLPV
jgi:hypothetical protein